VQFKTTPVQARFLADSLPLRPVCLAALLAGLSFTPPSSHAQAQAASAPAGKEEGAPSERAKRDAEKVFHWIMIHSDKPRKVRDGKDEKPATATAAPAAAPVAASQKPAPARLAKVGEGSAEGAVVPVAAPAPAPAPRAVQASAPAAPAVSSVDNEAARMTNAAAAARAGQPQAMPDAAAPTATATAEDVEQEPLVPVSQVEPQFPRNVMLDLRKGTVRVRFEVMPDGSVSAPTVVHTTSVRLNRAALAAVSQWRFQPLREAQEGMVELGFNLE